MEPLGRCFYEWWGDLGRVWRLLIAVGILSVSGVAAWIVPDDWLLWGPALVIGAVLVLFDLW